MPGLGIWVTGRGVTPPDNPIPALTSMSPDNARAGSAPFTLTVNGSSFLSSSVVEWNGSPRATTFVSTSRLTAAVTAADVAQAGAARVAVFNPAPGGGRSGALSFRIDAVPATSGTVVLKLDDGVFETTLQPPEGAQDLFMVNRLTPPAYPATLNKVQIYFHANGDGPGVNRRVGLLTGAAAEGAAVDGTRLRAKDEPIREVGKFNEYDVPPVTIESGDFVVGFYTNVTPESRPAAIDASTQLAGKALVSVDGRTFSPSVAGVFGFRAVVTLGK